MSDLDFLTTDEYAEIRRCGRRTIQRERETGRGCRYFQLGARVLYRRADIERYIEEHVRGHEIRTAATLNESLSSDIARPLAGQIEENEALNFAPVLGKDPNQRPKALVSATARRGRHE